MAVIYLIRHAAPAVQGVFLGSLDIPLAPGMPSPSTLDPACIFASPLMRARRTAEFLFPSREITVVPELAECNWGDWEGKTWKEIQRRWPELAARKVNEWRGVTPPGGEAWDDFVARVERAWGRIRCSPAPIAIVAHGGVNSVLAHRIAARDPFTFQQDYCEVVTLESED
jgi:broad specificity phosphatase PhoE